MGNVRTAAKAEVTDAKMPAHTAGKGENIMQVLLIAALGVLVGAVSGFDLGYEIGKDAGMRGAR